MSRHNRVLLLDIGNSAIKAGRSDGTTLLETRRYRGDMVISAERAARDILSADPFDAVVYTSVNPTVSEPLIDQLKLRCGTVYEVGTDLPRGVSIDMEEPERVGTDRTTTALAAYARYKNALIVVDFGSAITFDCIGSDGSFLGGLICPGISMAASALERDTALLPAVTISPREGFIGTNTEEAMIRGVYHGTIGMTNGILRGLIAEFGGDVAAVATGGDAETIAPSCPAIKEILPFLSLEGLLILWQDHVMNPESGT